MSELAVQLKGITKRFSGVIANDEVDFNLRRGEIHGLLGENGAGKTVLMSILYGLYQPDDGKIFVNDKEIEMKSPAVAISHGIGMVHQHFMFVDNLTVAENIMLGNEPTKIGVFLDMQKVYQKIEKTTEQYGLSVNPDVQVQHLSVGEKQRVEVFKMLYQGADILILDEPTAVLVQQEIRLLFDALRTLKRQGKSVIFITHKLKEAINLCDRITVLRKGKVVGTVEAENTSESQLAKMMVGREVVFRSPFHSDIGRVSESQPEGAGGSSARKRENENGDMAEESPLLLIKDIKALDNRGFLALKGISFDIKSYEILGLAGVQGNGQAELVEVLTGLRKSISGEISLNGCDITNLSARDKQKAGIAHIPEDRLLRGLVLDFTLEENAILGVHHQTPFARNMFIFNRQAINEHAVKLIENYGVKVPNTKTTVKDLSGGNQQRVIIGRELSKNPKLIVASQPTRGLDITGIEYVRQQLIGKRDSGCGVLLISMDLDEIMMLSDRIAVIYDGKIVAVKDTEETTKAELGALMLSGARPGIGQVK